MANSAYKAFVEAYNNFDYRPLKGESLRKFYVDDFTKDTVKSIKSAVKITERFRKILVIGHTGCGKSTILNKVTEELQYDYHVVSFSIADELNMMDIETLDILMVVYMQLIHAAKEKGIESPLLQRFEEFIKESLNLDEVGFNLLELLSFKIKVEPESREKIRKAFRTRLETLQSNLSEACETISKQSATFKLTKQASEDLGDETIPIPQDVLNALQPLRNQEYTTKEEFSKIVEQHIEDKKQADRYKDLILKHAKTEKDVLIIIDDLDKLAQYPAEKIFCQETHLLSMIDAKIIFTFPLATYYSPAFVQIGDEFTDEFIRLVNLYNVQREYQQASLDMLKKLVLKRIDGQYVSDDAMKYLIDHSGGLLRDLVSFMQDACKIAIDEEAESIDNNAGIPQKVVQTKINEYNRLFDFPKYEQDVREIMEKQDRGRIQSEHLIHLLRYRFILEYGKLAEHSWYDAHPCLKKCLKRSR